MYWFIEHTETERFESVIIADSWEEAIIEGELEFDTLSKHDQSRRLSVEVWEAERKIDEDFPEDLYIPDEETVTKFFAIK